MIALASSLALAFVLVSAALALVRLLRVSSRG